MLKSIIHRARLTGVELDYEGSISIDEDLLDLADIVPGEVGVAMLHETADVELGVDAARHILYCRQTNQVMHYQEWEHAMWNTAESVDIFRQALLFRRQG